MERENKRHKFLERNINFFKLLNPYKNWEFMQFCHQSNISRHSKYWNYKKMETTPIEAAQIVTLIQQGFSQRTIARQLHLSQSCVSKVYKRFRETGNLVRRPGSGRQRCTSARDDRFIVSTSLRNRHLTGVDVQRELGEVRGRTVSEWTVRRRLKEANLTPKRPATGPKLSTAHRQARLQFARDHLVWDIQQWSRVLFADETRMCLHGSDRRRRVYRRPGERYAQCCIAETVGLV